MTLNQYLLRNPDWVTVIYTIKDSHVHLIKTRDGKTHKVQNRAYIGVNMSRREFNKRRLKVRQHSDTTYFSTRKIVVTNKDVTRESLCRQGWIRLGLIPQPDFVYKVQITPEIVLDVPVVSFSYSNKKLTFVDDYGKKILSALIGKTIVCTGTNTFKILEK